MLFVEPNVGRGAKDGYVGILRSSGWPRLSKPGDDRFFVCNVGSRKFSKLRMSLGEVSPGGGSEVQNTDVLRVLPPG